MKKREEGEAPIYSVLCCVLPGTTVLPLAYKEFGFSVMLACGRRTWYDSSSSTSAPSRANYSIAQLIRPPNVKPQSSLSRLEVYT